MNKYVSVLCAAAFILLFALPVSAETIEEVDMEVQDVIDENVPRSCKPQKVVCCPRPTPVTPACGGIAQYARISNIQLGVAGQTVAQEANVLFNLNGLMTSGFFHSTSSNQDRLVILNPGTYKVTYHVAQNSEGEWGLFLISTSNLVGTLIPGSIYGARGSDEIVGHVLFCLSASDIASGNNILVLRNHTSNTPIAILSAGIGGLNPIDNASILIEQLNCPGASQC